MKYTYIIQVLKTMDKKQLLELFHDIDDIEIVQKISECAYQFVENFEPCDPIELKRDISDDEDARQIDDSRRYREWKSDQRN